MKKFIFGLVVGSLLSSSVMVFATQPIKLIVNGNLVESDVPPQIISGRTIIPARPLAEALGAKVEWDAENNAVVVTGGIQVGAVPTDLEPVKENGNKNVNQPISENEEENTAVNNIETYVKDGETFVIKDEVEYYPAHWIANTFYEKGYSLCYDEETQETYLGYSKDGSTYNRKKVLGNIPYEIIECRTFIKKEVYEDMILPIIDKN